MIGRRSRRADQHEVFDATATKGYFMGFQKKVTGHSYTGTPDTGLELLSGQDWVMRVTVK